MRGYNYLILVRVLVVLVTCPGVTSASMRSMRTVRSTGTAIFTSLPRHSPRSTDYSLEHHSVRSSLHSAVTTSVIITINVEVTTIFSPTFYEKLSLIVIFVWFTLVGKECLESIYLYQVYSSMVRWATEYWCHWTHPFFLLLEWERPRSRRQRSSNIGGNISQTAQICLRELGRLATRSRNGTIVSQARNIFNIIDQQWYLNNWMRSLSG